MRAFCPGNLGPFSKGSAARYSQEALVEPQRPKNSGELQILRGETSHTVQGFQTLNSPHPDTESLCAEFGVTKGHVRAQSWQIGGGQFSQVASFVGSFITGYF